MTVIGLKKIAVKFVETGLFDVKRQEGGTIALMSVELRLQHYRKFQAVLWERSSQGNFLNFRHACQYVHDFYTI